MEFNKNNFLTNLSNRVEEHTGIAVARFQNLPESVLIALSQTGGWSIAQCLDHLNSYGDFYLPQLRKALQTKIKVDTKVFKSGWLGNYFTKMMEPSDKKYKALKGHIPPKDLSAPSVVAKFIDQQEELLTMLQTARTSDLNLRVPISVSPLIRLKTGDIFRFLIAHNERHMQQALRNLH